MIDDPNRFSVSQLNAMFKAFFWRNALTNRYDQGFLTKVPSDLKAILQALEENAQLPDAEWKIKTDEALEKIFGPTQEARSEKWLEDAVQDGDNTQGALGQALVLLLNSRARLDVVSGEVLDRFSDERKQAVDLHHIFPKQWIADTIANLNDVAKARTNSIANLMPLSAESNIKWKTKTPKTAIAEFSLTWQSTQGRFSQVFIDEAEYDILRQQLLAPESFWEKRAKKIATTLHKLQFS